MPNTLLDRTAPIREDERFDEGELHAYLRAAVPGLKGAFRVEQFPGGHSNLTYLARVGKRELVVRRPPHGSTVKSAHDMGREFKVLSKLHAAFPPAPEPFAYCEDASVIGAPFYVMERVSGVIFRRDKPADFSLTPHRVRDACYSFVETLSDLHNIDYKLVGLEDLYKGPGYLQRQLEGWEKRWADAKTEEVPEMDGVRAWLGNHLPEDSGASIIHNDFKFDNIVFDSDRMTTVVGVLDWEMSTIGDPLSDLGVTLAHWAEPNDDPATKLSCSFFCTETGALRREELVRIYGRRTGLDVNNILPYYVLALYKGAGIVQQIYYRYHQGLTKDPRFAVLNQLARSMAQRASRAIDAGAV